SGLVRMYPFFRCPTCRQQLCLLHAGNPLVTCMPYQVEQIVCSKCDETTCVCEKDQKERHVDPAKHPRQELCAKCKAGIPCTRRY
ncbi:unnamed protein product, partial [Candidula unifasciata]